MIGFSYFEYYAKVPCCFNTTIIPSRHHCKNILDNKLVVVTGKVVEVVDE